MIHVTSDEPSYNNLFISGSEHLVVQMLNDNDKWQINDKVSLLVN